MTQSLCLRVPTSNIFLNFPKVISRMITNLNKRYIYNPLHKGRKLNVHKTFRRRHGRLLNVLCTFNLRSVSMGNNCFFEDLLPNPKEVYNIWIPNKYIP